jgi:hypothetical protein
MRLSAATTSSKEVQALPLRRAAALNACADVFVRRSGYGSSLPPFTEGTAELQSDFLRIVPS